MENEVKKWYVAPNGEMLAAKGELGILGIESDAKCVGIIINKENKYNIYLPSSLTDEQVGYLEKFTRDNAVNDNSMLMNVYREFIVDGEITYVLQGVANSSDYAAMMDIIDGVYDQVSKHNGR